MTTKKISRGDTGKGKSSGSSLKHTFLACGATGLAVFVLMAAHSGGSSTPTPPPSPNTGTSSSVLAAYSLVDNGVTEKVTEFTPVGDPQAIVIVADNNGGAPATASLLPKFIVRGGKPDFTRAFNEKGKVVFKFKPASDPDAACTIIIHKSKSTIGCP